MCKSLTIRINDQPAIGCAASSETDGAYPLTATGDVDLLSLITTWPEAMGSESNHGVLIERSRRMNSTTAIGRCSSRSTRRRFCLQKLSHVRRLRSRIVSGARAFRARIEVFRRSCMRSMTSRFFLHPDVRISTSLTRLATFDRRWFSS